MLTEREKKIAVNDLASPNDCLSLTACLFALFEIHSFIEVQC